ncbi:hypothetical protein [Mycobacterium sp. URHB0021]
MSEMSMRRATTADVSDIQRLIDAAYGKYVERIGRPPAPMTTDYTAAVRNSRVWLLHRRGVLVGRW